jgi:hypothetical protein
VYAKTATKKKAKLTIFENFAIVSFYHLLILEMTAAHLPIPGPQTTILICGPPPMVKFACLPNLEANGHKTDQIFVY